MALSNDIAVENTHPTLNDPLLAMENRLCPGCRKSAVTENGGLVVAFGNSFFHVDCFKCAKCGDQVTADTSLLLLSDGSPICANCSYSCNICNQPIFDEAIMTGDDSYHAHCFKCKICNNRIDELTFAKTTQGIYCMNCHNERMAKIRRHVQKKREREKAAGGGSGSTRSREREANEFLRDGRPEHTASNTSSLNSKSSINSANRPSTPRIVEPSSSDPHTSFPSKHQSSLPLSPAQDRPGSARGRQNSNFSGPSHNLSVAVTSPSELGQNEFSAPHLLQHPDIPDSSSSLNFPNHTRPPHKQDTLPLPTNSDNRGGLQRRKSFDDGVRPVDVSINRTYMSADSSPVDVLQGETSRGLLLPNQTSRSDKRRSINPGMALSNFASVTTSLPNGPSSLPPAYSAVSDTPSVHGRDSPRLRSPLGEPPHSASGQTAFTAHEISSPTFASPAPIISELPPPEQLSVAPLRFTPARSTSLRNKNPNGIRRSPSNELAEDRLSPGLCLPNGSSLRPQRSFDDRRRAGSPLTGEACPVSSMTLNFHGRPKSSSRSRPTTPTSPSHWADVPRSVESGTDTEAEGDNGRRNSEDDHEDSFDRTPPALPPKEKLRPRELDLQPDTSFDPDISDISQFSTADGEDITEGSVERLSIATFIAPALPPIRFSMSGADFSELLKLGALPPKSTDQLSSLAEESAQSSSNTSPTDKSPESTKPVNNSANDITPRRSGEPKHSESNGIAGKLHSLASNLIPISHAKSEGSVPSSASTVSSFKSDSTLPKRSLDRPALNSRQASLDETYRVQRPQAEARGRASSDSDPPITHSTNCVVTRSRQGSNSSVTLAGSSNSHSTTNITVTAPGSLVPKPLSQDTFDLVFQRLQETVSRTSEQQLRLEKNFVDVILMVMEQRQAEYTELKGKLDGAKRTSKQYIDGLTVAQTEYDGELKARRDAEAEVTRLRVLLTGQASRIAAMSGDARRQEAQQQLSKELSDSLDILQRDVSLLRVERDITMAEVEELNAAKNFTSEGPGGVTRSLTMRFDNIKSQYQLELMPLAQQREALSREIADLQAVRDASLEETTALNARNEELAQLSAQYTRRIETTGPAIPPKDVPEPIVREKSNSFDRQRLQVTNTNGVVGEDLDHKYVKVQKAEMDIPTPRPPKFKWGAKIKEQTRDPIISVFVPNAPVKNRSEHAFQQLSVLRFTRCDHCGDKMFGSQLRCSACHISVHVRCVNHVQPTCSSSTADRADSPVQIAPLPPSMFGRDLTEQVRADAKGSDRLVPIIVDKCIDAVEALALDYEGIYRKTGGSGQSKAITQLFERGDYDAFDLRDTDRFNDICSVTSVLKTYFRSLPVPLLTYDLHESFMEAAGIKDPALKSEALWELVKKLPPEHYYTLRALMLHLNHIREHSETNLMSARNLGVVFGPTLMRSRDPSAEFSDMAGKALSVEWLVENAPAIFES